MHRALGVLLIGVWDEAVGERDTLAEGVAAQADGTHTAAFDGPGLRDGDLSTWAADGTAVRLHSGYELVRAGRGGKGKRDEA